MPLSLSASAQASTACRSFSAPCTFRLTGAVLAWAGDTTPAAGLSTSRGSYPGSWLYLTMPASAISQRKERQFAGSLIPLHAKSIAGAG